MSDVTLLLEAVRAGDSAAAEKLFPLVYAELRQLAAAHMARERPGHTLQPTALLHEACPNFMDAKPFSLFFAAATAQVVAREAAACCHFGQSSKWRPTPFHPAPRA